MGAAASFAVLGNTTITNTGSTIISGDLGVTGGTSITGFPPGIVVLPGMIHDADAVAMQAQNDATAAYVILAAEPSTSDLSGLDLGGMILTSGVYTFTSSAQLTGTLTLDAENNPNAVFVFQIGTTLTTASTSSVVVINAPPNFCNKYWQVGSSATLGTDTTFVGNILAYTSITLNTGATLYGRALVQNGAVTLDSNTVTVPVCATLTTTALSSVSINQGESVSDAATVIGLSGSSPVPFGDIAFQVSTDGGNTFAAFGAAKTLDSSGNATSDSYTPITAGNYYFRAVYAGASYFAGSQSGDTAESLIVTAVAPPCPPNPPPPCPPAPPAPPTGSVTGTVASAPAPTGATNEYDLFINITGQQYWVAATTTDFPALLTAGASITGTLDNSAGWWVFKAIAPSGTAAGTVASVPSASGAANEYNLLLNVNGVEYWCAATTTNFPNLLTVGAALNGTLDHSRGWWIFIP